jgi:hypothetical protein
MAGQGENTMTVRYAMIAAALCAAGLPTGAVAQQADMSFFVTSVPPEGKGGNLGGLAGADAYCQSLAQAAGAGSKTWRAYLSTNALATPPVAARDRIGSGPWKNAKGVTIATSVADLHSANNKLSKETALSEKGEPIKGAGDQPNQHDIMTGATPDGGIFPINLNVTCNNWTSGTFGSAMVGHHDRRGLRDDDSSKSWNSSHMSRSCSPPDLVATGGAGLLYCFAAN